MAVIYLVSIAGLFFLVVMGRKSPERQNVLVWSVLGAFLTLCAQVLAGGILDILGIGITLVSMSVANLLFCGACVVWICRKGWQAGYLSLTDLAGVAVILYVIWKLAADRYGSALTTINFVSVDAAVHAGLAKGVALTGRLTLGRYFAALVTGMAMEIYRNLAGAGFLLYRGYIFSEVMFTAFSALLLWAALRDRMKTGKLKALVPTAIALIYWIGYPAYATLFGFSYFSVSICVLTALLFLLSRYIREEDEKLPVVVMLNLALLGVIVSYTLFVPAAFFGAFATVALEMWKKDRKKIVSWKNIRTMLAIFLIPTALGLYFNIQDLQELSPDTGAITVDGGCYSDLYSNFILLIPFTALGLYFLVRKKESRYLLPVFLVQLLFTGYLFIKAMDGQVSAYYYMKNNSLLWMLCWLSVGEALLYMMDRNKAALLFMLYFGAFLYMGFTGDALVEEKNPRFISVGSGGQFHVMHFNDEFYREGDATMIHPEKMDLYRYVDEHCTGETTVSVGKETENAWFRNLTGQDQLFTYGSRDDLARQVEECGARYICVTYTDPYAVCCDYINSFDSVYENGQGKIVQIP